MTIGAIEVGASSDSESAEVDSAEVVELLVAEGVPVLVLAELLELVFAVPEELELVWLAVGEADDFSLALLDADFEEDEMWEEEEVVLLASVVVCALLLVLLPCEELPSTCKEISAISLTIWAERSSPATDRRGR